MSDAQQRLESAQREAERQAFIEAIQRNEQEAKLDPAGHRRKVVLFAMFGYLFLLLPLALLSAVTVLMIWLDISRDLLRGWGFGIGFVTGFLALGWLRALFVRVPAPEGIKVRRDDAPGLFEMVESIRSEVALPRLSAVYLAPQANAMLYTRPMVFGLFGPRQQVLVLGVMVLAGLSPQQTRALIAHEFSHQRKDDSGAATWGYRVRTAWAGLAARGNILVGPILNWFAPRLDAMTFASAREAEYDADLLSVSMTDVETAGESLLRMTLVGLYYEAVIVPEMQETIGRTDDPPKDFCGSVVARLRTGEADREGRQQLVRALRDQTTYEDSHPSLYDRLRNIGYHPAISASDPTTLDYPPQPKDDALAVLFNAAFADQVIKWFDEAFVDEIAQVWAARRAVVEKSSEALAGRGAAGRHAVSEAQIAACTDTEALMETAVMIADTRGMMAAMPWIERALEIDPEHAKANTAVAMELLDADDPDGVAYAERALARDPRSFFALAGPLYAYHRGQGQIDDAEQLAQRLSALEEKLHHATIERTSLMSAKRLDPHDLSEMEIERLSEDIAEHPRVTQAHLFKMNGLKHMPEMPGYLLAVDYKQKSFTFSGEGDFGKLAEQVSESLRTDQWIVVYAPRYSSWLKRPCKKQPESEVFRREK
ncbi:MAG: M48 family metalloprotease [Planctomycetota bacterium]